MTDLSPVKAMLVTALDASTNLNGLTGETVESEIWNEIEVISINGKVSFDADRLAATVDAYYEAEHLRDKMHREQTGEYLKPIPGQVRIRYANVIDLMAAAVPLVRRWSSTVRRSGPTLVLDREKVKAAVDQARESARTDVWMEGEDQVSRVDSEDFTDRLIAALAGGGE